MTVGLPGCGKSTWAQQNIRQNQMFDEVVSSDEYRKRLLGNENDQSNNKLVFNTMMADTAEKLKAGISVCYDATNINRKDRKHLLNYLERSNVECEKIAVLFAVDINTVLKQNESRLRRVPDDVIYRMLTRFEIPLEGEGFDTINIVYRNESASLSWGEVLKKMCGYDQKNPNHSYDLYTHCAKCYNVISEYDTKNNISHRDLVVASLLHDMGKLYTQKWDEEKKLAHYIGHENFGAYKALFLDYSPLVVDKFAVAFYINYHMEPYRLARAKETTVEKYSKMFGDKWKDIQLLHEADEKAH